ncbi:uncharacterized protein LOC125204256 [Salvia hispanica]|uniref:uncharacterized protein LOC125204256 n=1 Tax=Salvia hispanica TaxID=49212 RepID=UPI0020099CE8|nr:uncharacterized protein LOC125204256 [Salvia hispanica]
MEPENILFGNLHLGMMTPLKVAYIVYDDPDKSFMQGETSMSTGLFKDFRIKISCLPMDYDTYMAHGGFNRIEKSNTVEIKFFDSERSNAGVEKIDYTLKDWLEMKLLKGDNDVEYYADLSHPMHWWDYIESDFKSVFRPIISGIRVLHCHGKYHGNLLNGIAITISEQDESVEGLLFGMDNQTENLSFEALCSRQCDDIKNLVHLIKYASTYPLIRSDPERQPPSPPSVVQVLCLQQLEDRISSIHLNPECSRAHWDLNPVLLWRQREMIDFLMMMYRILLTCKSKLLQQSVASAFVNKEWARQVTERATQSYIDMLNRDVSAQKTGMGKLRFYRNCQEHIRPENGVYSSMGTHTAIVEMIPELIPEVVNAAHFMITGNNFSNYVRILFADMNWKV